MSDGQIRHPDARKTRLYGVIGRELMALRKDSGLSLENVASALDTTTATLRKVEEGVTAPTVFMLALAAELFDVSLDELVPVLTDAA